jgi:hypothetical protein
MVCTAQWGQQAYASLVGHGGGFTFSLGILACMPRQEHHCTLGMGKAVAVEAFERGSGLN